MKNLYVPFLILALSASLNAATLDDFNGTAIDATKWDSSIEDGNSALTLQNGLLQLKNRGRMVAKESFSGPCEIVGSFRLTQSHSEYLRIFIRSAGTFSNPDNTEVTGGYKVVFLSNSSADFPTFNANVIIEDSNAPGGFGPKALVSIEENKFVLFKIVDTGKTLDVYVNNLEVPVLSYPISARDGDKIGFYNREYKGGADNITDFDFIYAESLNSDSVITLPSGSSLKVRTNYAVLTGTVSTGTAYLVFNRLGGNSQVVTVPIGGNWNAKLTPISAGSNVFQIFAVGSIGQILDQKLINITR